MLERSTFYADRNSDPDTHADLIERIKGEVIELAGARIVIGTDKDGGFPAVLILAGAEAVAVIDDNGALGTFAAYDTNGTPIDLDPEEAAA